MLGLVSTKGPELETADALKWRIDEASKYIPLDQLAISPQCGFASDVVGNLLSAARSETQARTRRRSGAGGVGVGEGLCLSQRLVGICRNSSSPMRQNGSEGPWRRVYSAVDQLMVTVERSFYGNRLKRWQCLLGKRARGGCWFS